MRFTRHGRIGALLRLLSVVVMPLTTGLFRRDWRHLDRIPATGPAILAVNHVSYADPFLIARLVWDAGRIPRFLGKATLFALPVVGAVLRGAGQIPVRRATPEATDSLESAVAALRRGQIVVIYPEGTVTRDEDYWPMVAKTGVARLALLVPDVPVIPVAQWGSQHAVDWYHRRFRLLPRTKVTIAVGAPIDTGPYRIQTGPSDTGALETGPLEAGALETVPAQSPTPQTLRALTDEIMTAVSAELAGIRGVPAPATFAPRPPAGARAVATPPTGRAPDGRTADGRARNGRPGGRGRGRRAGGGR